MINVKMERLDLEHLEWARQLHNDPDVLMMLTDPRVVSEEDQKVWFENLQKSKSSMRVMAIINDEPVGLVRLDQIDYNNLSICVGLDIHKDHRGRGYAKPIYQGVMDTWFNFGFNRVWLMVASYNTRALKLYKSLGFVHEGTQREALLKDGVFHDYHLMAVLKKDWHNNG